MIGLVVTVIGDVVVTAAVLFVALTVVYWFGHLHGWRAAARHLRAHNPDASTVLPDLPPLPLRLRPLPLTLTQPPATDDEPS